MRNFCCFIFIETTVAENPDVEYWKYRDFNLMVMVMVTVMH